MKHHFNTKQSNFYNTRAGILSDKSILVGWIALLFAVAHIRRCFWGSTLGVFEVGAVEVLVICFAIFIAMTNVVRKKPLLYSYISPEWGLLMFGLMLSVNLLLAAMAPPFDGYDSIAAFNLFHNYILSSIIPYFIVRSVIKSSASAERLIIVAVVVGVIMSLLLLSGLAETTAFQRERGDLSGIVKLPLSMSISIGGNTTALYGLFSIFLGYALWLAGSTRMLRICGMFSFLVVSTEVIYLSTRAVLLVAPIGLIILTILILRGGRLSLNRLFRRRYILFALLLLALLTTFVFKGKELIRFLPTFQQLKIGSLFTRDTRATGSGTLDHRLRQYSAHLKVIATNPIGNGISTVYPEFDIQPHGIILALLLRTGWGGLVCYYVFVVGVTRFWYRSLPCASPSVRPILVAMIILNVCLIMLSWGYDFMNRFGIQLTYFMLCALTTVMALNSTGDRKQKQLYVDKGKLQAYGATTE